MTNSWRSIEEAIVKPHRVEDKFWCSVSSALSIIFGKNVPSSPAVLLLNDVRIPLSHSSPSYYLGGHNCWKEVGGNAMESTTLTWHTTSSVAKIHGAKQDYVKMLNNVKEQIKGLIS